MNLHEYQAKQLFEAYGIEVPRGMPARQTANGGVYALRIQ